MNTTATTADAYKLFHRGAIALAAAEAAGIRIDVGYLDRTTKEVDARIKRNYERLRVDPVYAEWRKAYGAKANLQSRAQLAHVLFKCLGYPAPKQTATGRDAADDDALSYVDLPFVRNYLKTAKLEKLSGTYLKGVRREVVDGLMHCNFKLASGDDDAGGARSYRGSSSGINFQNVPIRDPYIGKIIRTAFVPRSKDHALVEIDGKAMEVCISACYNQDPTLLKYLREGYDMHKDMAAECYLLSKGQVTKEARQAAKGDFVFASFYGSYFAQTAPALWRDIERDKLTTADGVPLYEHLAAQGITELGPCDRRNVVPGTFEAHIKAVDDRFWNQRFPVYTAWKKSWYEAYLKTGGFQMLTGFRVDNVHARNDVINYPVQGSSFHCLLWSFIQLTDWLRKNKMRSVLIGNIHDSIVADVHRDELADFVGKAVELMTVEIKRHWPWIIAPMSVEIKGSFENWWNCQPIEDLLAAAPNISV